MVALPRAPSMFTGEWLVWLIAAHAIASWDDPSRFR
jgi:hypothetical protein